MPTLNITTSYQDGEVLTEAQLDEVVTQIEAHYNITGLEGSDLLQGKINGASKTANAAVTTTKLANSAITSRTIEDGYLAENGVKTSSIANSAAQSDAISPGVISTRVLADGSVEINNIADDSVPKEIQPEIIVYKVALSNQFTDASGYITLGSISLSGLEIGKPILIALESLGATGSNGRISIQGRHVRNAGGTANAAGGCLIVLEKDALQINTCSVIAGRHVEYSDAFFLHTANSNTIPPSSVSFVDIASSETHTYTFKVITKGISGIVPSGVSNETSYFQMIATGIIAMQLT